MATKVHEVDVEIDGDMDAEAAEASDAMTLEDDEPAGGEATETTTEKPAAPTDAELLACIHEAHAAASVAKHRWIVAKEDAKAAKEEYDLAVDMMMRAISQKDEVYPLFEKPATKDKPASDEAWRAVAVDELVLSNALKERLGENDIWTIGDLENARANGLTNLKGIGQGKADVIEEAVLAWLSEHRDNV